MAANEIRIGMGEGVVASGSCVVSSLGIGSCVVVTLYDAERKAGGFAHVMLPDSLGAHRLRGAFQCADTAIATLLAGLRERGSRPADLVAKIAGGARMFSAYENGSPGIGRRNIRSVRNVLARIGIPLAGWDVAGHHGRSVAFYLATGRLVVRALGFEDKEF
jgi:chemotaxis protein CheD